MKSWTRTLNLDDAHTLLAMAEPGRPLDEWADACHSELPSLSMPRRRELVRMLRDGYLDVDSAGRIADGLFLRIYRSAPAMAQIDLVRTQWVLTHPLSLVAVDRLVGPALDTGDSDIPLDDVERLVADNLVTGSAESRRKTRTVLLGALEGIGVLDTSGTGQHRSLRAARGAPHAITFGYLTLRELSERGVGGMLAREAVESGLAVRLTRCTAAHARSCYAACLDRGLLVQIGDEVREA